MSNKSEIVALENNIQRFKELVEVGKAIERLYSNRDFKRVIVDGYLEKEAVRLVLLKADVNMQSDTQQASIVKQMDGIGALLQYIRATLHSCTLAERTIATDEETIADLIAEEGSI